MGICYVNVIVVAFDLLDRAVSNPITKFPKIKLSFCLIFSFFRELIFVLHWTWKICPIFFLFFSYNSIKAFSWFDVTKLAYASIGVLVQSYKMPAP